MPVLETKPRDCDLPPMSDHRVRSFYETACLSGWSWPRDVPGFDSEAFPLESPDIVNDLLRRGGEVAETALRKRAQRGVGE